MFQYHPSDIVAINTRRYNCVHQTKNTVVLRPEDDPDAPTEAFSNTAIDALRRSNQWRYYPSLEAQNRLLRRTQEQGFALSSASKKDRERAIFIFMEVMAIEQLRDEGEIVLTPNSLEENWHKFTSILNNREIVRRLCGRALRAGEELPLRKPHRPATLLKKARRLRTHHYDIGCLLPQYGQNRSDPGRLSAETEQFISDYIRAYADPDQPKKSHIASTCITAMKDENLRRARIGEPELIASERSVERRIEKLDPFEIACFREGVDEARRRYASPKGGISVQYPLEGVELDAWKGDIRTIFARLGILEKLPKDLRDAVPTGRRWIYAAIDRATRVIVGLRIAETPSSEEARKALNMIFVDKTEFARAVGAESHWAYFGGMHQLACDTGSDFISDDFTTAVNTCGSSILFPPVKVPELRGRVERLFGTMARQLMPRLTGRTFSSIEERGDHPTERRVVLDDDDLLRILVLYVVDHYHHQPHRGLGGQTPANRWAELAEDYGVSEPPDINTRRVAFGIEFERKPSKMGVVAYCNHYSCPELEAFWRKHPKRSVRFRIDPANIGAVSVEVDKMWYQANAVNGEELEGVTLPEWIQGLRDIRKKYAKEALLTLELRNATIAKIKAINTAARKRAQLLPTEISEARLKELEKRLCAGTMFDHPQTPPEQCDEVPFGRKVHPHKPNDEIDESAPSDQGRPDPDDGDWEIED